MSVEKKNGSIIKRKQNYMTVKLENCNKIIYFSENVDGCCWPPSLLNQTDNRITKIMWRKIMTIHTRSQSSGLRQKVKAGQTKNNNFGKKYKVQRCRMNDKTWKYLDMNKNDRDFCLVGRCGIYWSVQDRREICFQVRAQVRWTIRDREGVSQWKKVLRLEPYRFLLLFWNPPKYGYPNIYLDGLESCKLWRILLSSS